MMEKKLGTRSVVPVSGPNTGHLVPHTQKHLLDEQRIDLFVDGREIEACFFEHQVRESSGGIADDTIPIDQHILGREADLVDQRKSAGNMLEIKRLLFEVFLQVFRLYAGEGKEKHLLMPISFPEFVELGV